MDELFTHAAPAGQPETSGGSKSVWPIKAASSANPLPFVSILSAFTVWTTMSVGLFICVLYAR